MKEASAADDVTLRSLMGMFGLHGDIAFQDAGTLVGRREDEARARAARRGPQEPAVARRADEQPRPDLADRDRRGLCEDWPGAMVIVSHDPEFVTALAPERVLLMPDGQLDYFGDDHLDLVELA